MSKPDPFGFSTATQVAAKIASIQPDLGSALDTPVAAIDRVADAHGFRSREPAENMIVRRRREVGPSAQLNVKCPVPVYNRFIRFCDQERLSYREGIERLLDLAEVSAAGARKS